MKPETEYIARQLAGMVLRDDAEPSRLHDAGTGAVTVDVEMRGMMRTVRQSLLVDHVALAGKVADEIERQTKAVNLDALIAAKVGAAIARAQANIDRVVVGVVQSFVEERVRGAVAAAARDIGSQMTEALTAAAFEVKRKPRKARR